MIRVEKNADGRIPHPARSGYISENRGTILGKSSHGGVHPAVFRDITPPFFGTWQGGKWASTNQLCPFHAVNK